MPLEATAELLGCPVPPVSGWPALTGPSVAWRFLRQVAPGTERSACAAESGLPGVPKLLVGEWSWQLANVPGTGVAPWRNYNYFVNDWAGAFAASSLIEMQHAGVMSSVYANPVAELGTSGSAASG